MIAPGPVVGIVEDDDRLRQMIVAGLAEEGFRVALATRRGQDLLGATGSGLDVAILDIGLPDSDGRDVVSTLRASGSDLAVLLLTALSDLEDRLSGLRAGADDYLPKPFSFDELVLRTHALARRNPGRSVLDGVGRAALGTYLDHAAHAICHADRRASLAHRRFGLGTIVAFWTAYILTRPLGASMGDYMSQPTDDGGLALGTVVTSCIFLGAIVLSVVYLILSRSDAPKGDTA